MMLSLITAKGLAIFLAMPRRQIAGFSTCLGAKSVLRKRCYPPWTLCGTSILCPLQRLEPSSPLLKLDEETANRPLQHPHDVVAHNCWLHVWMRGAAASIGIR